MTDGRDAKCECDGLPRRDEYYCEACEEKVFVCSECSEIVAGCECGHCEKGGVFHESE